MKCGTDETVTKKKQEDKMLFQQGDVLIENITNIPVKAIRQKGKTLAEGEATGHHHTITKGDAELYEHEGSMFLRVKDEATLTHQEHSQIVLPKGDYMIRRVREYDHFSEEARRVQD